MKTKIVITCAGSGGSNNLIRTLKERNKYFIIGTNIDKYKAAKSNADKNYILPHASHEKMYLSKLKKLINLEKPDLIVAKSDAEVKVVSKYRDEVDSTVFLPDNKTIELCQNKLDFYKFAKANNIDIAKTFEVSTLDCIENIFHQFDKYPLWCRLKNGSGSTAATKLKNPEQARFWISYWNVMRKVPVKDFIISEYLPGRDFACQSLWNNGELILMKAAERLSYYGGSNKASGMSSTPELAKTIYNKKLFDYCINLIGKISFEKPNGIYSIDLKLNSSNEICVTEVNIGRFFMITTIFNLCGKYSMIDAYLKLALNRKEDIKIDNPFDFSELYMSRDLDTLPLVMTEKEINKRSQQL